MYVGRKYTATRTRNFERFFRCSACGFESDVRVVGVGTGEGNSAYFLDNTGASERAQANAERAAEKNAELLVKICPCPECGCRDSRELVMHAVLGILGLAAGVSALGWLIAIRLGPGLDFFGWIMTGSGLVGAGVYYWLGVHLPWTTAKQRVAFPTRKPAKRRKRQNKSAPVTSSRLG